VSNGSVLEFRRRSSLLATNSEITPSIILRPSIFRANFRPLSLQARDYARTRSKIIFFFYKKKFFVLKVFQDDLQTQSSQTDSCLTPATDSDSPLLIEEYHQLFRIIMLHVLEDTREIVKNLLN